MEIKHSNIYPDDFQLDIQNPEVINYDQIKTGRLKKYNVYAKEDISITNSEFYQRGFLSSEKWDRIEMIHAKLISIGPDFITCECLLDKENLHFNTRSFPKYLFNHLNDLSKNRPILIKIRSKTGSSRIDIYDGIGIVNLEVFNTEFDWNELKNSNLDVPKEIK